MGRRAPKILSIYRLGHLRGLTLETEYNCRTCEAFTARNCTGPMRGRHVADPDGEWLPDGWLFKGMVAACPALGYRSDLAQGEPEPLKACPQAGIDAALWQWLHEFAMGLNGHGAVREDMTAFHIAVTQTLSVERGRMMEAEREIPREERISAGVR